MHEALNLGTHLRASRAPVSAEAFSISATFGHGTSWATWGETTEDLTVFESVAEVLPRLRRDVVLIDASYGLVNEDPTEVAFGAFHRAGSGGDTKLRNAVTGTELEGAFLTHLVKDHAAKYATQLVEEFSLGQLDVERHITGPFFAEQRALGFDSDTLYVPIGAAARELWDILVDRGHLPAEQSVFHRACGRGELFMRKPVENLRHFSSAVNMANAVRALLAQPFLAQQRRSQLAA